MKIAIVGSNNYDSLEYNLNESFNYAGHKCQIFDIYNSWLYKINITKKYYIQYNVLRRRFFDSYDRKVFTIIAEKIISYKPDLVICVYRFIHPIFVDIIKNISKCKVIHINPDALTTFELQQVFTSKYDVWFTKDPYIKDFMCNKMNLNTKLYVEAFNKRIHVKPQISKKEAEEVINIDIVTYGTMYPYRCKMIKLIADAGINIKCYGTKPNRFFDESLSDSFQNKYLTGKEKARILYGSKIVFNQMHYAEIESVNNRFFETNGIGAFQICDYKPILHELLPIDPDLVSFKTINEGIEKIKYFLNHPIERYEISSKIYEYYQNKYSYDNLISYILLNIE